MVLEQLPPISEDESSFDGLGRYENTSWDETDGEEDYEAEVKRKKKKKKKKLRDLEKEKNDPEVDPLAELMNDGSISVSSVDDGGYDDGSIDLNDVDFDELEALASGTTTTNVKENTAASYGMPMRPKRVPPNRETPSQKPTEPNVQKRFVSFRRGNSNADSDSSDEFDVDSEIIKNEQFDGPDAWKASDTFIPVISNVETSDLSLGANESLSRRQGSSRMNPEREGVTVNRLVLKQKKKRDDSSQSSSSYQSVSQQSSSSSRRQRSSRQSSYYQIPAQNLKAGQPQNYASYQTKPMVVQKGGKGQHVPWASTPRKGRQSNGTSTGEWYANGNQVQKVVGRQQGATLVTAGQQYYVPQETRQVGTVVRGGRKMKVKEVEMEEDDRMCSRGAVCGCFLLALFTIGVLLFLFVFVFRDNEKDSSQNVLPNPEEIFTDSPSQVLNFPTPPPSLLSGLKDPTFQPTISQSTATSSPSLRASPIPTAMPTLKASSFPTISPTFITSTAPTSVPSTSPTSFPSTAQTTTPSSSPTISPTFIPSATPTTAPSGMPTGKPTPLASQAITGISFDGLSLAPSAAPTIATGSPTTPA